MNQLPFNSHMMVARLLFIVFLILNVSYTSGQNRIESNSNQESETAKIDSMLARSDLLLDIEVKEGYNLAETAIRLSNQSGDSSLIAKSTINLGNYARENSQFDTALEIVYKIKEWPASTLNPNILIQMYLSLGLTNQKTGDHELALEYFGEATKLARSIGDTLRIAIANLYSADTYSNYGQNKKSKDLTLEAYRNFGKLGNKKYMSVALNLLGDIHAKMGQSGESLEHFFEGLELAEEIGNLRVQLKHYNRLGAVYAIEGKLDESIQNFNKALDLSEKLDSKFDYSGILNNIAYIHILNNDLGSALLFYKRSIQYNRDFNLPCLIPYATEGIARVYEKQNKLDSAVLYFNNALQYVRSCQMHQNEVTILQGLGRVEFKRRNQRSSITNYREALKLAQSANFKRPAMEIAFELYKIFKKAGDYKTALNYHEIYKLQQDSVLNKNNIEEVTRISERHEFDKERERLEAEKERESLILQEEIKRQDLSQSYFLIGLIMAILLIAALIRLYYKKRIANKALIKLNEEKNALIGVVAHDLRSPLNNVIGLIPLIKENVDVISQDANHFFDLMNESTERMKDMINRVLDINAIESHKINLNLEVCDIAQILIHVAENFKQAAEPKQIRIEYEFAKDKYLVRVDKNYLIQVFDNLVSNAIKFSPKGTTVKLDVFEEMGKVNAIIKDEGPGFSNEDQKSLFGRYNTLSAKPTDGESSTGLGLSIVKKYIEAMKGLIFLDSRVGQGTTFTLQFNSVHS